MKAIRRFLRYDNLGWLYVLPALVYMLALTGWPIVSNIMLSLQDVTVRTLRLTEKPFVGLANYRTLFEGGVLTSAIFNTLLFTVLCLVFQFVIGFLLALFFNRSFATAKFVRGLLMMPWMIPIRVTALIFKFIFGTDVGILNQALVGLGLIAKPVEWLTQPGTAMAALIVANVWIGIPFNMILLSVGLSTVPKELYESASIDGANAWQSFRHITLPMIRSSIESVLILGFIYTFKVFDLVLVMTGGGPVNATQMLSTYSYKQSFTMFKYGEGAAIANVLFVILMIAAAVYLKFAYNDGEEDAR